MSVTWDSFKIEKYYYINDGRQFLWTCDRHVKKILREDKTQEVCIPGGMTSLL